MPKSAGQVIGKWYRTRDGHKLGPFTSMELRELVNAGALLPTDELTVEDRSEVRLASTIEGLFPDPAAGPSNTPAPVKRLSPPRIRRSKRHTDLSMILKTRKPMPRWVWAGAILTVLSVGLLVFTSVLLFAGNDSRQKEVGARRGNDSNSDSVQSEVPKRAVADPPKSDKKKPATKPEDSKKKPDTKAEDVKKPVPTPPKPDEKPKDTAPKPDEKPKPPPKPDVAPDFKVITEDPLDFNLKDPKPAPQDPKPVPPTDTKPKTTPPPDTKPKTAPPDIKPKPTTPTPTPDTKPKVDPKPTGDGKGKKPGPIDDKVKSEVEAALKWIAKSQLPAGNWPVGRVDNNQQGRVAITSFCGLALMAHGDQYEKEVKKAANFVADNLFVNRNSAAIGGNKDQSNWKVSIGGLFLCEYWAYLKDRNQTYQAAKYQQIMEKTIPDCIKRMEPSGGWGHTPKLKNPLGYVELEVVSNWMLATMGSSKKLGVKVPDDDLKKAIKFIDDCCNPGNGSVGYSPRKGQKGMKDPCRTGAALFDFALLGQKDHPLYPRMVAYYKQDWANSGEGHASVAMGMLESSLGARQISDEQWKEFKTKFFPIIAGKASKDGTFKHLTGKTPVSKGFDNEEGDAYNTGIYTLILQLDRGSLNFMGQRH